MEDSSDTLLVRPIVRPIVRPTSNENTSNKNKDDLGQYRLLENIPLIPVDWALAFVLIKALKTPEGQRLLQSTIAKWLDTQARIVTALAESGSGNIVTAWTHSHLIAQILEHNYMIRKGGAQSIIDGANWLTGALTAAEIFGSVAVPTTLVFSGAAKSAVPKSIGALLGK